MERNMERPTADVFTKWAALPEWEKHYRQFLKMPLPTKSRRIFSANTLAARCKAAKR